MTSRPFGYEAALTARVLIYEVTRASFLSGLEPRGSRAMPSAGPAANAQRAGPCGAPEGRRCRKTLHGAWRGECRREDPPGWPAAPQPWHTTVSLRQRQAEVLPRGGLGRDVANGPQRQGPADKTSRFRLSMVSGEEKHRMQPELFASTGRLHDENANSLPGTSTPVSWLR